MVLRKIHLAQHEQYQHHQKIINIIFVLCFLFFILLLSSCTAKQDEITLGFIGLLSGAGIEYGQAGHNGAILAIEEINNKGGIQGKKIRLISEDTRCDPKSSVSAITKLSDIDKVHAVIGGICSSETLAAAPIAESRRIIMISPCSSAPKLSESGDYIFRNYPSDSFQGKLGAEYAYNSMQSETAALIFDNNEWGAGIKEKFVKHFVDLGGSVVVEEAVDQEATDYKTPLTKIAHTNPDFIYIVSSPSGTINILQEAVELGLDPNKMMGADGSYDDTVAKETYPFSNGFRTTAPKQSFSEEKIKEYESKFGVSPSICAVQAYDIVYLLAEVMNKVGTDSEKIKNALYAVSYQGESGVIEFDHNGDLKDANYLFAEIRDGGWIEI